MTEWVFCTSEWDEDIIQLYKMADDLKPANVQTLHEYNLREFEVSDSGVYVFNYQPITIIHRNDINGAGWVWFRNDCG